MRRYNIIINRVRKILVTVNQFPRDKTLTFFHRSSIKIIGKIIIKMYLKVQYINSIIFEVKEQFLKLGILMVNQIKPITFKVIADFKQRDKLNIGIPITFLLDFGFALMVKLGFEESFGFELFLEPLVGRFRKLGEMDDTELGHWDDMTLGDVDFITL